jgi:hypothetical protein
MIPFGGGGGAGAGPRAWRWPFVAALLVCAAVSFVLWAKGERVRALAELESRWGLRVGGTEGRLWPTRVTDVALDLSPSSRVNVASVELGFLPWQRELRARGVVVRARGPLDGFWEAARSFSVPADVEVLDARIEYTDASGTKLRAEGASFVPGPARDHLHVQALHAFGTKFREVHVWASRPRTVLELRLSRDAEDSKAPTLQLTPSPGAVEWGLDIPSQPFSEWARNIGLNVDEEWSSAVVVGVGSLIVPDAPAAPARANLRFTLDDWRRPRWPEAALLVGRSGAIALRLSPGAGPQQPITRVEVSAGLFSLVGRGELVFGEPNRLTFDAQGDLSCRSLLEHLPASRHRERVQAHLREPSRGSAEEETIRLELAVRAEAPRGRPLEVRWHLRAGCGLPEMKDD